MDESPQMIAVDEGELRPAAPKVWVLCVVIAAHAALTCWLAMRPVARGDGIWFIAVPATQNVLVTSWAVFSRLSRIISVAVVVAVIAATATALVFMDRPRFSPDATAACSLWSASNALFVGSVLVLVRIVAWLGRRWRKSVNASAFQFGIAHMFVWTAVVAVALSVVTVVARILGWSWAVLDTETFSFILVLAIANTLFALTVYANFASRINFLLGPVLVFIVNAGVVWLEYKAIELVRGIHPNLFSQLLILMAAEVLLLYATLLPLKAAGWPIFVARQKTATQ